MIFFGVMILAHDGIRLYSVHYGPKIYKETKPYMSAFLKNLPVKVTWRQVSEAPPLLVFVWVVKQFCRFGIWYMLSSLHITPSPPSPPPVTHCIECIDLYFSQREGGEVNWREGGGR
jgi:hypothetical protein